MFLHEILDFVLTYIKKNGDTMEHETASRLHAALALHITQPDLPAVDQENAGEINEEGTQPVKEVPAKLEPTSDVLDLFPQTD
jgi:hypothetical protein